jgi:hypothetical protein
MREMENLFSVQNGWMRLTDATVIIAAVKEEKKIASRVWDEQ